MPCSCRPQEILYPDNVEWGPLFWIILHGLAQRAGTVATPYLQGDDIRGWAAFLKATAKALPCPQCREHYSAWMTIHTIQVPSVYPEMGPWVRNWLWQLHEHVNRRLGKTSLPFESLAEKYRGANIGTAVAQLEKLEKKAIQLSGVSLLAWNEWLKQLKILRSLYGI